MNQPSDRNRPHRSARAPSRGELVKLGDAFARHYGVNCGVIELRVTQGRVVAIRCTCLTQFALPKRSDSPQSGLPSAAPARRECESIAVPVSEIAALRDEFDLAMRGLMFKYGRVKMEISQGRISDLVFVARVRRSETALCDAFLGGCSPA